MDSATRRNLEIDQNLKGGEEFTSSPSSTPASPPWGKAHAPLAAPTLRDADRLGLRQDAIAALLANYHYEALRSELKPSAI